jgi:hypothetical protein
VAYDQRVDALPAAIYRALQIAALGLKSTMQIEYPELIRLVDTHGMPPGEVDPTGPSSLQVLATCLQRFRDSVEQEANLVIPLDAEALHTWRRFLEDWLRAHDQDPANPHRSRAALEELVQDSFGARSELLCPKSWDWKHWS